MESLPLVPGYNFSDPTIQDYKLKQKFNYINGFRVLRDCNIGIGRRQVDAASSAFVEQVEPAEYDTSLTYGRVREYGSNQFVPRYVLYEKKCLNFKGFFKEGVFNSPDEHYRIRKVNLIYYLEDDTISVIEPTVENSGLQQGRIVRRSKIFKNNLGDVYSWKDFNVGIDIEIHGIVYHITDCDKYTKEYLESQGIDVGEKEESPEDPYIENRRQNEKMIIRKKEILNDARRKFLEYDKMILRFDATWNEDFYQIIYFLTDDTIAVKEIHKPNDGKDPTAMLLNRRKIEKNWKDVPSNYPSVSIERGDEEVTEYYSPVDLKIGQTINIYGRNFFLYDCDKFTRNYYKGMLNILQPDGIDVESKTKEDDKKIEYVKAPPHINFGTPEDTLAGCLNLVAKLPKKNLLRQLLNSQKKLRYSMTMDAVHPEDEGRDFILEYNLSDGSIQISENEKRNSGRRGGAFLSRTLVPKPGSDKDNPDYYTPEDFYVGSNLNIFNHRFIITGADLYVYRYVKSNPDKFSQLLIDNIRNYFLREGLIQDEIDSTAAIINKELRDNRDLDKSIGESFKDDFDNKDCIKSFNEQASIKYEGENGEFRIPTPPAEDICPGLTNEVNESTSFNNRSPDSMREREFMEDKFIRQRSKKEIKWSDQIVKDRTGHPIISCKNESKDCKKITEKECSEPNYFKERDRRFEVDQLMYERATEPQKPEIPLSKPLFNRDPGERTITMLRKSCRYPYPPT